MTPEEKEAKIFAMQAPSTQAAMLRHKNGEIRNQRDNWPPKGWKAFEGEITDDNYFEKVGARPISFQEAKVELGLKYFRGQYLAEMRKEAPVSSVDEAKRERAIDAFMMIKETFTNLMEKWGLVPKKEREFDYAQIIAKEKNEK